MDKLTTLAISYPDFQLNQIIDPEQMDLNNLQIVNKINNIIKSFNELIQGTSGAGNITIAPIPEFSDATTVQQALQQIATFVKTLDADAKRQLAELVQKNSQQDTEIQSIKSVNTQQDNRLQSLESTQTNHTQRIGAIEQKNTSQDNEINAIKQKNNEQDGRLTTAEGTINTHTSQISKVQEKDVEQDRRLSEIESREILDDKFVENVEKRVKANEGEIKQIKQDLDALEATDPSLEVTLARTSGHTQQTYNSIGKRLDSIEIPIQKDFEGKEKGNVNFRIVSEDTTAVWENDVKIGDLNSHNEDPTAHAEMMAVHEMDDTAHGDIREVLKTHTHTKSQITDFAHTHTKSEISDFPTSLPANGGNADTVDGFHAYQLQCLQNTGSPYGDRWLESKWNGSYFNTYSTNASGEVLGLNVANADTVDGKHASDFASSTHNHDNLYANKQGVYSGIVSGGIKAWDNRNMQYAPEWYMNNHPTRTIMEFKTTAAIGITGTNSGYCYLETHTPWNDSSGGYPMQIAWLDTRTPLYRWGTNGTTWSAWKSLGGGDSVIKSIQRGVFNSTTDSSTVYEKTISISTINPSKSSVSINGGAENRVIYIKSVSSNNFVVASNKDMNVGGIAISWEVVEYA